MNPKPGLTKLIGLPQVDGWSQIISIGKSPQIIILFSVAGQQAKNVGRDLEEMIAEAIPDSAATLYSLLTKLDRIALQKDCQLSVVAGYLQDTEMVLAAVRGGIVLRREGKVGMLLQASDDIRMLEGQFNPEDKIVFLSQAGWQFKEDLFQKLGQGWDIDSIVSSLTAGVHTLDNSSLIAFAFVENQPVTEAENVVTRDRQPQRGFQGEDEYLVERETVVQTTNNQPLVSVEDVNDSVPSVNSLDQSTQKKEALTQKAGNLFKTKVFPLLGKIGAGLKKLGFMLWGFFKKLIANLKKVFDILLSKKEYLNSTQIKKKTIKILALVVAIAILLLGLGVGFGWWRRSQVKSAQQEISSLDDLKNQSALLVAGDPIQARELAQQVVSELEAKSKKFEGQYFANRIFDRELSQANEFLDSISGQEQVHDLAVFYDLQEHFPQFIGSKVAYAAGRVAVLDPEEKDLVLIDEQTREGRLISLEGATSPRDIVLDEDTIYLLDEDKVLSVDTDSGQTSELISDENLAGSSQIAVYLDHVYALNPDKRNVFKFTYDDGDYLDPTRWVRSAPGVEFDQLSSIQVDGSVWLAGRQGQVFKLAANQLQDWEISGLPADLESRVNIFTGPDFTDIYLLEPNQQRLVIVNQAGQFVKEITSSDLAAASSMVVNDDETKALIISGSLIFEIDLS